MNTKHVTINVIFPIWIECSRNNDLLLIDYWLFTALEDTCLRRLTTTQTHGCSVAATCVMQSIAHSNINNSTNYLVDCGTIVTCVWVFVLCSPYAYDWLTNWSNVRFLLSMISKQTNSRTCSLTHKTSGNCLDWVCVQMCSNTNECVDSI